MAIQESAELLNNEKALLSLALIRDRRASTIEDISHHLGVTKNSASSIVGLLYHHGMLLYSETNLMLTKSGQNLLIIAFPDTYSRAKYKISNPFGSAAAEVESVDYDYERILVRPHFFEKAISPNTSIIIGRRGSGKTFLANYLSTKSRIKFTISISIDTQKAYSLILPMMKDSESTDKCMWLGQQAWEFLIWTEIATYISATISNNKAKMVIERYSKVVGIQESVSGKSINSLTWKIFERLGGSETNYFLDALNSKEFNDLRNFVIEYLDSSGGALVVIDTLERYSGHDRSIAIATASLIWASYSLSAKYVSNLQIKCFARSEVFNSMVRSYLPNPAKIYQHVVTLNWTTKELKEVATKRLKLFVLTSRKSRDLVEGRKKEIDNSVDPWALVFPLVIKNPLGIEEKSFPYLLRHTQLEPRHIVLSLNEVMSIHNGVEGSNACTEHSFREGIRSTSYKLAKEILNAYDDIYPNISSILSVFRGEKNLFSGNNLDRMAPRSKKYWPDEMPYDRSLFVRIVSDVGFIGRTVNQTDKYVEAAYSYGEPGEIWFSAKDQCVIHPVFYEEFDIRISSNKSIYPYRMK